MIGRWLDFNFNRQTGPNSALSPTRFLTSATAHWKSLGRTNKAPIRYSLWSGGGEQRSDELDPSSNHRVENAANPVSDYEHVVVVDVGGGGDEQQWAI